MNQIFTVFNKYALYSSIVRNFNDITIGTQRIIFP